MHGIEKDRTKVWGRGKGKREPGLEHNSSSVDQILFQAGLCEPSAKMVKTTLSI